jgi:hypothetical protein
VKTGSFNEGGDGDLLTVSDDHQVRDRSNRIKDFKV